MWQPVILQSIYKTGDTFTGICGATISNNVYYCRFSIDGDDINIGQSMSILPKEVFNIMRDIVRDNKINFLERV
jgi:hypothetical protein